MKNIKKSQHTLLVFVISLKYWHLRNFLNTLIARVCWTLIFRNSSFIRHLYLSLLLSPWPDLADFPGPLFLLWNGWKNINLPMTDDLLLSLGGFSLLNNQKIMLSSGISRRFWLIHCNITLYLPLHYAHLLYKSMTW